MSRSQILLLIISWVTVASAGYVAGQASAVTEQLTAPKAIQTGCASSLLPQVSAALDVSTVERAGMMPARR